MNELLMCVRRSIGRSCCFVSRGHNLTTCCDIVQNVEVVDDVSPHRLGRHLLQSSPTTGGVFLMGYIKDMFMMYASYVVIDVNGDHRTMLWLPANTGLWKITAGGGNSSCTDKLVN